jgi:hypothetical protein
MAEATYGGVPRDEGNRRPDKGKKTQTSGPERKDDAQEPQPCGEAGDMHGGGSEKAPQQTGFTGKRDYEWRKTSADDAAEKDHVARRD